MKKLLYILPVVALLFTSCSDKNVLEGNVTASGAEGKTVYLLSAKDFESQMVPIDSAVIKNGKFKINLDNIDKGLGVGYVVFKEPVENVANGISVILEEGKIKMTIDSTFKVTGTPLNDKNQQFFDMITDASKKGVEIQKKMQQASDETERQTYMDEMDKLSTESNATLFQFIKENMSNQMGEFYFRQFIQAFNLEQFEELLSVARPEYKQQFEELLSSSKNSQNDFIGHQYADITGPNPQGKDISLSDYIGKNKVVLVDFWASWCGPCRVEMPNVVEAYKKYKSKGFEIVGVSLDESKDDWNKAIKDMKMNWPQMSDLKGWQSDLGAVYSVQSIPFTLLIDQDGKIIAQNLRGEELEKKLEEVLN